MQVSQYEKIIQQLKSKIANIQTESQRSNKILDEKETQLANLKAELLAAKDRNNIHLTEVPALQILLAYLNAKLK